MFRSATTRLVHRVSDLIDDMLVGDYIYMTDGEHVYADVDYYRKHPHHEAELSWTPAAGRGFGPQRPVAAGPKERRPGTVPARAGVCVSPARAAGVRPATVAGRTRTAH